MLCQKGTVEILDDKNYLFQPKLDGTRAIYRENKLINRRSRDIKYRYPEFDSFKIEENCILDGEVIVYNKEGLPDFNLLQSREQTSKKFKIEILSLRYPATYVIFDCLKYKGEDITMKPIEERLALLDKIVEESKNLQIIVTSKNGRDLWNKINELGLEGIIAKRRGSRYHAGKRSEFWLKIKNLKTIDCIIQGYTKGEGKRESTFGALYIGVYDENHQIKNIGKVGTGWSDEELINLKKKMDTYLIEEREDRVLIEPHLVCEVEFLEFTKHGDLRAPSFKRLRFDKAPEDCRLEDLKT